MAAVVRLQRDEAPDSQCAVAGWYDRCINSLRERCGTVDPTIEADLRVLASNVVGPRRDQAARRVRAAGRHLRTR